MMTHNECGICDKNLDGVEQTCMPVARNVPYEPTPSLCEPGITRPILERFSGAHCAMAQSTIAILFQRWVG